MGYKQWVSKSKSTRLFKHNILLKKKTIQYKNNIVESSLQKVQRHRSPELGANSNETLPRETESSPMSYVIEATRMAHIRYNPLTQYD